MKLNGLYSDEMHIQQDWGYFQHHDHGEFALRYVSDGLARGLPSVTARSIATSPSTSSISRAARRTSRTTCRPRKGVMHVFGASPEAIRQTALLRARYYHLLQDGVVDLFVAAKRHAEQRMGHRLEARAHATWAESPTIDCWDTGREPHAQNQYEYTSNFSLVVHGPSGGRGLLRLFQMGRFPDRQRQRSRRGRLARPRLLRAGPGLLDGHLERSAQFLRGALGHARRRVASGARAW